MHKNRKTSSKWLVFAGIPVQIGATIYFLHWIGTKIDQYWEIENEWGMKIMTLTGVFLSVSQVIREVKKINQNE